MLAGHPGTGQKTRSGERWPEGRTFPAIAARSVDCHGLPLAAQRCARGRWPRVGRLADVAASKAAASAESLDPTMRRTPGHPRGPMPTQRRGRERPPPRGKRRRASRPSNQKRWCESLPLLAVGRPWQLRYLDELVVRYLVMLIALINTCFITIC